jgi:hypothetical protein
VTSATSPQADDFAGACGAALNGAAIVAPQPFNLQLQGELFDTKLPLACRRGALYRLDARAEHEEDEQRTEAFFSELALS